MTTLAAIAVALHAVAAVVWVGGMFFAYIVLRPSLGAIEPSKRLALWNTVFARFFVWVWCAVIALLASGYFQVFGVYGGFGGAGVHIHIMHLLGLVMTGLFVFLYLSPYGRFRACVASSEWPQAGAHLNAIRRLVATNLVLGLVTVAVGASGRFWG